MLHWLNSLREETRNDTNVSIMVMLEKCHVEYRNISLVISHNIIQDCYFVADDTRRGKLILEKANHCPTYIIQ